MNYRSVPVKTAFRQAAYTSDDRIAALFTPSTDYLERAERLRLHQLKAQLTRLSRIQLQLLLLTVLYDFSVPEAAESFDLPEPFVARTLVDAREQLLAMARCPSYREYTNVL